jgi:hypothetical protein
MELISDSSWLPPLENNFFDPLWSNEFMPSFPSEAALPMDSDFTGETVLKASAEPVTGFVAPHNPPLDSTCGMLVDASCEESVKPSVLPVYPFSMFLPSNTPVAPLPPASPSDLAVPTRKRRKRDTPPSILPQPSQVSDLLKLEGVVDTVDSMTFDGFISELRNFRALSSAEESLVKRVTKKIKNRESARKSRQAKKDHNADLETRVSDLVDLTQDLKIVCSSHLLCSRV